MLNLARELKQTGITVNMLNPGMIATQEVKEMLKKKLEEKELMLIGLKSKVGLPQSSCQI